MIAKKSVWIFVWVTVLFSTGCSGSKSAGDLLSKAELIKAGMSITEVKQILGDPVSQDALRSGKQMLHYYQVDEPTCDLVIMIDAGGRVEWFKIAEVSKSKVLRGEGN